MLLTYEEEMQKKKKKHQDLVHLGTDIDAKMLEQNTDLKYKWTLKKHV